MPSLPEGHSIAHRVDRPAGGARAHRIDEHLWALQLPLCYPTVVSVNAYLLAAEDGWILFDCGSCLPPGWAALEVALKAAGVAPHEISLLIASHSHTDHRGLATEVIARTGARFAMGPAPHPVIDLLRDPTVAIEQRIARGRGEGVPAELLVRIVSELPATDVGYPEAEPQITLLHGDRLGSRCGEWEVLALPGHSADQIGLWNAERRWLISADLALPGQPSFLEYGTRPDPQADQMASLALATTLAPELLLTGHGRPPDRPLELLRGCRAAMEERLDTVSAALSQTPRSTWEIAGALIDFDAQIDQWQRSLIGARAILEHLRSRGLARGEIEDDGIWRWRAGQP